MSGGIWGNEAMNDKQALRKLIEAVEGGTWRGVSIVWSIGERNGRFAWEAYHGSLDAAKALHEALLPGWDYCIDNLGRAKNDFCSQVYDGNQTWAKFSATPARAWLLAILKAYRAGL